MIVQFNLQPFRITHLLYILAIIMGLLRSADSNENLHASTYKPLAAVACRLIPDWADLVYLSTIHGGKDEAGIVPAEIYATDSNGTNTLRLTYSLYAYLHVTVSPGRDRIAAGRIIGDTNGNGSYELSDVKRLCVINPAAGEH